MEDVATPAGVLRNRPSASPLIVGERPTGGGRGIAPKSARAAPPRSRQNARRTRALRGCRVCQAANENRPIASLSKLGGSSQAGGGEARAPKTEVLHRRASYRAPSAAPHRALSRLASGSDFKAASSCIATAAGRGRLRLARAAGRQTRRSRAGRASRRKKTSPHRPARTAPGGARPHAAYLAASLGEVRPLMRRTACHRCQRGARKEEKIAWGGELSARFF